MNIENPLAIFCDPLSLDDQNRAKMSHFRETVTL